MNIPKACLKCISSGNYPCNDCIFRFPCREISELFNLSPQDEKKEVEKPKLILLDTS